MKSKISSKTKKLTLGAILSAMGVSLLLIGSLFEVLDLSMAALASIFCIFAVIEIGGIYPYLIYVTTGILAIIFMPMSLAPWFYMLFFGFYPIIKEKLEKLNKTIAWAIKMLVLNLSVVLCVFLSYFVFFGNSDGKTLLEAFFFVFGNGETGSTLAIITYILLNITFIIYDIALTRIITVYLVKLRHRFKFLK